jgi:hypothetical protein
MLSKIYASALQWRSRNKNLLLLGIAATISLSALHCNSSDTPVAPVTKDTAAVQILAPLAGAQFKLSDTNLIILQIDTARFNRTGLYIAFSADSGKCWAIDCLKGGALTPYKIKGDKGAIRKDTIKWVPKDNFAEAGQSVKVRIIDYPPSTITLMSGYFTIKD